MFKVQVFFSGKVLLEVGILELRVGIVGLTWTQR